MKKRIFAALLAAALVCAALPMSASAGEMPFADVPEGSWYYNDVLTACRRGLVSGTTPTTYSPNKNMTAAEAVTLAAFMNRQAVFGDSDFPGGSPWYQPYVDYCRSRGIITRDYQWNSPITRAEYLEIFANCLPEEQLEPINIITDGAIPDVPMTHPQAKAIYKLYRAGVVYGVNEKHYCSPQTYIKRSEVAVVLNHMVDPDSRGYFSLYEYIPPDSLSEIFGQAASVWVDGSWVQGLTSGGVTYVSAADLTANWPWFSWQGDENAWQFSGQSPNPLKGGTPRLSCTSFDRVKSGSGVRFGEEYWLPVHWVAEQFSFKYLWDADKAQAYLTSVPQIDLKAIAGRKVPILMYHAVSDDTWGSKELFVSPSSLRAQLEYLLQNGYDPIFFSDLAHLELYDKPVMLTFDDGYLDNYTELFPLLKEYHVKATIFVISEGLDYGRSMKRVHAREMSDSGLVDIQSHTANHLSLPSLSRAEQEYQMARAQLQLARVTGKIPYVLAYPFGGYNQTTKAVGPKYYDFGVRKEGGVWRPTADRFEVTRSRVDRSTTLSEFIRMLS